MSLCEGNARAVPRGVRGQSDGWRAEGAGGAPPIKVPHSYFGSLAEPHSKVMPTRGPTSPPVFLARQEEDGVSVQPRSLRSEGSDTLLVAKCQERRR